MNVPVSKFKERQHNASGRSVLFVCDGVKKEVTPSGLCALWCGELIAGACFERIAIDTKRTHTRGGVYDVTKMYVGVVCCGGGPYLPLGVCGSYPVDV